MSGRVGEWASGRVGEWEWASGSGDTRRSTTTTTASSFFNHLAVRPMYKFVESMLGPASVGRADSYSSSARRRRQTSSLMICARRTVSGRFGFLTRHHRWRATVGRLSPQPAASLSRRRSAGAGRLVRSYDTHFGWVSFDTSMSCLLSGGMWSTCKCSFILVAA